MLDDTQMRRLLVYLAAASVASGQPVHEVEADIRLIAAALGVPGVQLDASPTGVVLSLGGGTPATFESIDGPMRLDQATDLYEIRQGLIEGELGTDDAITRLRALRRIPHRYQRGGHEIGMLGVSSGIALVLQPTWPSVAFAALAGQVTAALMRASSGRRSLATLLPFVSAFVVGWVAFAATTAGLLANPLQTLLAPIAVMLPGALIVTSVSELANGAMKAGSARLVFGISQLLLFAFGVAAAAWIHEIPAQLLQERPVAMLGPWSLFAGVALVAVGIGLMESVPAALVGWIALVLAGTVSSILFGRTASGTAWFGDFLGSVVATFGAHLIELYRPRLPRLVIFLPSFWLLVPGSL